MTFIVADLPTSIDAIAGQTTRIHLRGQSVAPYTQFNLALHVDDTPATVHANRMQLLADLACDGIDELVWLTQVHGTAVYMAGEQLTLEAPIADAVICRQQGVACVIMTADCLPIILADQAGTVVGCVHAGWRGLLAGVIEQTIECMRADASFEVVAWLGAAIGATMFEVGAEVFDAFVAEDAASCNAFDLQPNGKYLANIYTLARLRLSCCGITHVTGGERCTVVESDVFYSYRAAAPSHQTGRMATIIALRPASVSLNQCVNVYESA